MERSWQPRGSWPPRRRCTPQTKNYSGSRNATRASGDEVRPQCFDICHTEKGIVKLNASLLTINKERRRETKCMQVDSKFKELRSGMVLLERHLNLATQVEIVQMCRALGLGSGGFYQPQYSDGAKMHLHMMCLGKNWDPETRAYGVERSVDGASPPFIPKEFKKLVEEVLHVSRSLLNHFKPNGHSEDTLPLMSPDICIVNFYTTAGKLGLHQDRDESNESLRQGLPVVSFSLGDTAEFLYSDERDMDKAEKIELKSGDVLIFGGMSRHIFHGVPAIHSDTAPKLLLAETNLRPGRLNLTFRQY